jgi:hypothetical protein
VMTVLHQPEALPAAVYIHFFFFPLFSLGVLGSQFCFQIFNVRVSGSQKYTILLLLDHAGRFNSSWLPALCVFFLGRTTQPARNAPMELLIKEHAVAAT